VADQRLYDLKHANHGKGPGAGGGPRSESPAAPAEPSTTPATPTEQQSAPTRPIPFESKRAPEKLGSDAPLAAPQVIPTSSAGQSSSVAVPPPHAHTTVPRKAERVSMSGTNAYAVLGESGGRRARVLDLGFGGVALELETGEEVPPSILAILHVPILPPVRVQLRAIWSQRTAQGAYRIGCAFVS
jgi:hypothetical protein